MYTNTRSTSYLRENVSFPLAYAFLMDVTCDGCPRLFRSVFFRTSSSTKQSNHTTYILYIRVHSLYIHDKQTKLLLRPINSSLSSPLFCFLLQHTHDNGGSVIYHSVVLNKGVLYHLAHPTIKLLRNLFTREVFDDDVFFPPEFLLVF